MSPSDATLRERARGWWRRCSPPTGWWRWSVRQRDLPTWSPRSAGRVGGGTRGARWTPTSAAWPAPRCGCSSACPATRARLTRSLVVLAMLARRGATRGSSSPPARRRPSPPTHRVERDGRPLLPTRDFDDSHGSPSYEQARAIAARSSSLLLAGTRAPRRGAERARARAARRARLGRAARRAGGPRGWLRCSGGACSSSRARVHPPPSPRRSVSRRRQRPAPGHCSSSRPCAWRRPWRPRASPTSRSRGRCSPAPCTATPPCASRATSTCWSRAQTFGLPRGRSLRWAGGRTRATATRSLHLVLTHAEALPRSSCTGACIGTSAASAGARWRAHTQGPTACAASTRSTRPRACCCITPATASPVWRPFALGATGAPPEERVLVTAAQEDELRAFCSLVTRRTPRSGPLAWALRAGSAPPVEAPGPEQALTDVPLALRALLEPEGTPGPAAALAGGAVRGAARPRRAGRARRARDRLRARRDRRRRAPTRAWPPSSGSSPATCRRTAARRPRGHLDADLRAVADRLLDDEAQEQPTLA